MSFLRIQESPSGGIIEILAFEGMTLFRVDSKMKLLTDVTQNVQYSIFNTQYLVVTTKLSF